MSEFVPIEAPRRNASNEELNAALFKRPEHTIPDFPHTDAFRHTEEPSLLASDELVRKIATENRAALGEALVEGMPRPCLTIIAGSMFGETRDTVLDAAYEHHVTKEVPAWFGDGMSYIKGSLLPSAGATGVAVRLFVPYELLTHQATREAVLQAGLQPDEVLVTGHDLGNLLPDLGPLAERRRTLTRSQQEHQGLDSAERITLELQEVNDAIDKRLAKEDAKLQALVTQENEREGTDAVIVIMPPYTPEGDTLIRGAMTNPDKDIDGLGDGKRWDQITAEAALRTLTHIADTLIGRPVPADKLVLLGLGKLVGKRIQELANPGIVVDGREAISSWAENPGTEGVAAVITAHRGAEIVKANRIPAARWGKRILGFMARRKELIIVDVGSVTRISPTGQRSTVGNLDPRSLPEGNTVKATGARHGVGPVTGVLAMQRTIQTATDTFHQKQAMASSSVIAPAIKLNSLVSAFQR